MQAWRTKSSAEVVGILALVLSAPACGGSDGGPPQQTAVLDGAVTAGAASMIDASPSTVGASAASGDAATLSMGRDAGGTASAMGAGLPEAGVGADAGSSNRDAAAVRSDAGAGSDASATHEKFSFFVTSLNAMRMLSGNRNGFGGDLRHGETGEGAGLRGADKICSEAAELGMPGASAN